MGLFKTRKKKCFCAFCKSERKVYTRRTMGPFNFFSSFFGAAVISYIVFQGLDPRGLIFFLVFLMGTEIFLQLRWRLTLVCPYCGFDPILYLRDLPAAVVKVQQRLDRRKNDPMSLLATPLNLAVYRPPRKEEASKQSAEPPSKSRLLSRQV